MSETAWIILALVFSLGKALFPFTDTPTTQPEYATHKIVALVMWLPFVGLAIAELVS